MSRKQLGDQGELEGVKLCKCPNCGGKLVKLPDGYPMIDTQCRFCQFQAQIKTTQKDPARHKIQMGASSKILKRAIDGGRLIPFLIINYKWQSADRQHQEIRFYPFIKPSNLAHSARNIASIAKPVEMYNYLLSDLPFMVLYQKSRKLKELKADE